MKRRKFSPFYSNNLSKNFNHTMNRIYDMVERKTYSKKKVEYQAQILSGYFSGTTTTNGFFDKLIGSLYEHESHAYKIRFHGKDKDYNSLPDPLNSNRTEQESINLINLHPWAYTSRASDISSPPSAGDIVVVTFVNGVYIIKRNITSPPPSGGSRSGGGIPTSGYRPSTSAPAEGPPPPEFVGPVALNPLISSIGDEDYVFLFGDSQMQSGTMGGSTMGDFLESSFKNTDRVGKAGWTARMWVNSFNIDAKRQLEKKPKLVIIILGGNGVSANAESEIKLVKKIKSVTPDSKILWIGAVPPASDGDRYNLDGKQLEKRKKKSDILEEFLSPEVDSYINPYKVGNWSDGYSCTQICDGIHLPGKYAKAFLEHAGVLRSSP